MLVGLSWILRTISEASWKKESLEIREAGLAKASEELGKAT